MSFILDALRKAAKDRDRQIPVLQRLLAPGPEPAPGGTRASGRLLAALLLNAGLLTALLVLWLRPAPVSTPPDRVATPTSTAPAVSEPTESEPRPRAEPRAAESARSGPRPVVDRTPGPAAPERSAVRPSPPKQAVTAPAAPRPLTLSLPDRPGAARRATPETAKPAAPPARPTAAAPAAGLRLEALIYSDLPSKRMIFVNGIKYVAGDLIDGRIRVEEIREDGVTLDDQGHRFTLQLAR